jgi:hypothetical protein
MQRIRAIWRQSFGPCLCHPLQELCNPAAFVVTRFAIQQVAIQHVPLFVKRVLWQRLLAAPAYLIWSSHRRRFSRFAFASLNSVLDRPIKSPLGVRTRLAVCVDNLPMLDGPRIEIAKRLWIQAFPACFHGLCGLWAGMLNPFFFMPARKDGLPIKMELSPHRAVSLRPPCPSLLPAAAAATPQEARAASPVRMA